jgi:hypothetical protein
LRFDPFRGVSFVVRSVGGIVFAVRSFRRCVFCGSVCWGRRLCGLFRWERRLCGSILSEASSFAVRSAGGAVFAVPSFRRRRLCGLILSEACLLRYDHLEAFLFGGIVCAV